MNTRSPALKKEWLKIDRICIRHGCGHDASIASDEISTKPTTSKANYYSVKFQLWAFKLVDIHKNEVKIILMAH